MLPLLDAMLQAYGKNQTLDIIMATVVDVESNLVSAERDFVHFTDAGYCLVEPLDALGSSDLRNTSIRAFLSDTLDVVTPLLATMRADVAAANPGIRDVVIDQEMVRKG